MPVRKPRTSALTPLRGVLFDWDGTLLNSYDADQTAYLEMFREMGIPWTVEDLERHYSPDWYRVYRAAKLPPDRWAAADRRWRTHYAGHRPKLMPGARRVLSHVARDYDLGLVTSGDRSRVCRQLKLFGLWETFGARVCGGDTDRRKPHPAPLFLALRRMNLPARDTIYVGDTPEDIEMARAAGVRAAIAIFGPFPTAKRLRTANADVLLDHIQELPAALKKFS